MPKLIGIRITCQPGIEGFQITRGNAGQPALAQGGNDVDIHHAFVTAGIRGRLALLLRLMPGP